MRVTPKNFGQCLETLLKHKEFGLDSETTGLLEKHRLFNIIIACDENVFLFNFRDYDVPGVPLLSKEVHLPLMKELFGREKVRWYISNAKFDMRMLFHENLGLTGNVWCTSAMGRVLKNNLPSIKSYSLDSLCDLYLDKRKSGDVKAYIEQNHLWDTENWFGETKYHHRYQDVPPDIMFQYSEIDAQLHLELGKYQSRQILAMSKNKNEIPILPLAKNEEQLTKTLFTCERRGVKVNVATINDAMKSEYFLIETLKQQFQRASGFDFYDGSTRLVEVFKANGLEIPKTEKGNPSFSEDSLEGVNHPLVNYLQDIRWYQKRINTYYPNYLYYADQNGIIHPDIRQNGAETGRMSCINPNLTNIPSDEGPEVKYPMRSHFVPRVDGNYIVSIDYKQQELRMMLDMAGEKKLIDAILDGEDPHQTTADAVGCTRKQAKAINFAMIYGTGVPALAKQIGTTEVEAKKLKENYFEKFKKVKKFIYDTRDFAKKNKVAYNWFGRRCYLSNPEWAYIIPNHVIQGGCADVVKIAMNKILEFELERKIKSPGMLFSVHDEIVFELRPDELAIIQNYKDIMESVYTPRNGMPLSVDVSHSKVSWAKRDLITGSP